MVDFPRATYRLQLHKDFTFRTRPRWFRICTLWASPTPTPRRF